MVAGKKQLTSSKFEHVVTDDQSRERFGMHPDEPAHHRWNYSDDDALGPSEWPKYFETGSSQSPINIIVDHCYLHRHSLGPAKGGAGATTKASTLHEQLERRLAVRGERLDSAVGHDDDDDANRAPSRRPEPAERSPSSSSHNSSVSTDSTTSNDSPLETSKRRQHHHHDHHHNQRQMETARHAQNTRYCATNKKIFLGYPRYLNSVALSNTGHGWQVDMPSELACHTSKFARRVSGQSAPLDCPLAN